ncbi:MAG: MliC family protein [Patescibacteria group bacterium]|nr:MliC family protein [Patescibacteria group bacterium]
MGKKSRAGFAPWAAILIAAGIILVAGGSWYILGRRGQQPAARPLITVTAPAAADSWAIGSTHLITWTTANISPGNKISITLRRIPPPPLPAEGQEFDPVLFTNLESTGSVDWTIASQYPSGTYVLGITSYASIPVEDPIMAESAPFALTSGEQLIGGQKDAHGCLKAAGYSWCAAKAECIRPWETYCTAAVPKTALFSCDGSKTIAATFYPTDDKYVDLVLSDGTKISLPRAMSASGARYAKADESFVFWNKGDTAFITENGTTTYSNCVTGTP